MKTFTTILFITIGLLGTLKAQPHGSHYETTFGWSEKLQKVELIGGIGFTQFMGDAGGADAIGTNFLKDFDFDALRPSFLVGARYRFNEFVAFRLNFQYGILKGHDQYTSYPGRTFRNLGFRSPLVEWGGLVEFYFLPDYPTNRKNHYNKRYKKSGYRPITAYIATGIAGCYFNPVGDHPDGNTYELATLNTEGQGMIPGRNKYDLTSLVIPVNLGVRYRINDAFSIDMELCYRKAFTDYMDDISETYVDPSIFGTNDVAAYFANPVPGTVGTQPGFQRGDPTDPDGYMFLMFNVSWKLTNKGRSLPKYYY